eukprot:TRINITY_DN121511_c0_g1_i1.p1 TRINITY_DN121511_c0_g1~~TRINITY_DN121511_c0_g1_i1.p1  ORF type:complete len:513 (+),score=22.96 TRINITY_DN121511_c0_g1_i1:174-1712(+)
MPLLVMTLASGRSIEVELEVGEGLTAIRRKVSKQLRVEPWQVLLLDDESRFVCDEFLRALVERPGGDSGEKDFIGLPSTCELTLSLLAEEPREVKTNTYIVSHFLSKARVRAWRPAAQGYCFKLRNEWERRAWRPDLLPCPPSEDPQFLRSSGDFRNASTYMKSALRSLRGAPLATFAEICLAAGCDPNMRDHWGVPLLHLACHMGQGRLAKVLLKHGAEPLAESSSRKAQGLRALDYAMLYFEHQAHNTEVSEDDLELMKICCQLLRASTPNSTDTIEAARRCLHSATTEVALFKRPAGAPARVTRQEVEATFRRQFPDGDIEAHVDAVWAGWPWKFLSFVDAPVHTKDASFYHVRSRLLTVALERPDIVYGPKVTCQPCLNSEPRSRRRAEDMDDEGSVRSFRCDCSLCDPTSYWDLYFPVLPWTEEAFRPASREYLKRVEERAAARANKQVSMAETNSAFRRRKCLRHSADAVPCKPHSKSNRTRTGYLDNKRQARPHAHRQLMLGAML